MEFYQPQFYTYQLRLIAPDIDTPNGGDGSKGQMGHLHHFLTNMIDLASNAPREEFQKNCLLMSPHLKHP